MKDLMLNCAAGLPLFLSLTGLAAAAAPATKCELETLNGQYVFTASGFTRAPGSVPGTPWVPKAIVEVLRFNGDGTLTTPVVTVANPFGDTGNIAQPPAGGSNGTYEINENCSGSVTFADANGVAYKIQVDGPGGDRIWMIQTNPLNNVFPGTAIRTSAGTDCEDASSELGRLVLQKCK